MPAFAADMVHGGQVFASNCAACHIGGGNVVNAAKTFKISDLEQYEMASIEAIKNQVTNGKNAMPAFAGRTDRCSGSQTAEPVLANKTILGSD